MQYRVGLYLVSFQWIGSTSIIPPRNSRLWSRWQQVEQDASKDLHPDWLNWSLKPDGSTIGWTVKKQPEFCFHAISSVNCYAVKIAVLWNKSEKPSHTFCLMPRSASQTWILLWITVDLSRQKQSFPFKGKPNKSKNDTKEGQNEDTLLHLPMFGL